MINDWQHMRNELHRGADPAHLYEEDCGLVWDLADNVWDEVDDAQDD